MLDEYQRIANLKNKKRKHYVNTKWTNTTKNYYTNSVQTYLKTIAEKYGVQRGGNKIFDSHYFVNSSKLSNHKVLEKQYGFVKKRFPQYYINTENDRLLAKKIYSGLVGEIFSYIHTPLKKEELRDIIKKSTDNTLLYLNYELSKKGETLEHILQPHIYKQVVQSL